jgi:hypothetical protein
MAHITPQTFFAFEWLIIGALLMGAGSGLTALVSNRRRY